MDCREVAELAPQYLTGEIDAARAAAMDAHLQSDPVPHHSGIRSCGRRFGAWPPSLAQRWRWWFLRPASGSGARRV